jgi:hypothetical protein
MVEGLHVEGPSRTLPSDAFRIITRNGTEMMRSLFTVLGGRLAVDDGKVDDLPFLLRPRLLCFWSYGAGKRPPLAIAS